MNFDFSIIEENMKDAEQFKEKNKQTTQAPLKPGMRPLKIEQNHRFSPIKARIIEELNSQDKVQKDLYDFCTMRHPDNNSSAGMREANGIINGLVRNEGL